MTNEPNSHIGGIAAFRGLGKSAFALALSGILAGTAFAGNAGNEADYITENTTPANAETVVTSSITFTGAIAPATVANNFTLRGVDSLNEPVLNGAGAGTPALDITTTTPVALIKNLHFTQFSTGAVTTAGNIAHLENIRFSANTGGGAVSANKLTDGITTGNFVANTNAANGGALAIAVDLDGEFNNVRFANNESTGAAAGGIYVGQDFGSNAVSSIVASDFNANKAATDGGAIAVGQDFGRKSGQSSAITGSSFSNNTAAVNGGAISVGDDFDGVIDGSNFVNNAATAGSGGALSVGDNFGLKAGTTSEIKNTTFDSNTAGTDGGAIAVAGDFKGNIDGSTFESNVAAVDGGAISVGSLATDTLEASISNSTFKSNIATAGSGGAIASSGDAKLNIDTASAFEKNTAAVNGGAISVGRDLDGVIGATFKENDAVANGGAVYVANDFGANSTDSSIDGATFDTNTSGASGGAVYVTNDFKGNIANSAFNANDATVDGGAVYVGNDFAGDVVLTVFENNKASGVLSSGGAIYVDNDFDGKIDRSAFRDNTATASGGAIHVANDFGANADSSINEAIFSKNIAAANGGAVYVDNDFKGNITNTQFSNNESQAANGGALFVGGNFTGDISGEHTLFDTNKADVNGGAIAITGNLAGKIADGRFLNNEADNGFGGAAFILGNATGNVENATFRANESALGGGAVAVGANFTGDIKGLTFEANKANAATADAGAFGVLGNFDGGIDGSTFKGNTAGRDAGAVGVGGNFDGDIKNSTFDSNTANNDAGAIGITGNFTGNIVDSTFTKNVATNGDGGAIGFDSNVTGDIKNSTFEGNTAGQNAGAVGVGANFVGNISGSTFDSNVANNDAGAIGITGNFTGNIVDSTFNKNVATTLSGGAIGFGGNVTGNITGSTFTGNEAKASAQGGGAFFFIGDFTGAIEDSDFRDNVASERGGAIATWNGSPSNIAPDIKGSTFIANKADGTLNTAATNGRGGAIAVNNGFTIQNSNFLANEAIAGAVNWGAADGVGGAIHYNAKAATSTLTLDATAAGDRILFYGNTNQLGGTTTAVENAIHFANEQASGTDSVVTVNITGAGDLLLLDGISSQDGVAVGRGRVEVNVNKAATETGDVYLGGRSTLRDDSTWAIDGGSLVLVDVNYGSGAVATDLNLAGATAAVSIGQDAVLAGSGTIHANHFALDGGIDPSTWENTGTLANAINSGISAANIAAIDVKEANTIGKLTLDGDVTLGANTVYYVDARTDGSAADNVTVNGTLVIDPASSIALNVEPGIWTGPVTYQIVNATNVLPVGTYGTDAFNSGYLFIDADVETHASGVDLHLTRNNLAATIGTTYNQTQTGVAIDGIADANPVVGGLLNIVTVAEALDAFDNLSGEVYSSTGTVLLQNSSHVRNLVADRLAESEVQARARGIWGSIYGYTGELKGNANSVKAENDSFGFAVGGDIPLGQSSNIGLLLGYETADIDLVGNRASNADVDTFNAGLYFGSSFGNIQFRSGLAHSRHDIDTNRSINAGTISGNNTSNYDADLTQLFVDFAYPIQVNEKFSISPYAGISQLWLDVDGARESGTDATLETYDWSVNTAVLSVGLRFNSAVSDKVALHGGLGWQHAFDKEDGLSRRRFWNSTGTSADFTVRGARLGEDVLTISLGISGEIAPNHVLGLDYRGEVSSQQKQHGGQLHYSFRF